MKSRSCAIKQWPRMTDEQRKLAEDNHNLIYAFLNRRGMDSDEWYGAAAVGLCHAAITYDPAKYTFATYAYRCMLSEIAHDITTATRAKRTPPEPVASLDYEYASMSDDRPINLMGIVGDDTDFTGPEVDELLERLPASTVRDIRMRMAGYTPAEINHADGQSRYTCQQRIKHAAYVAERMGYTCGA